MVKRKIIKIDEEKCNGCGLCIPNCPEGALKIIDGKVRLTSDLFCDGLGACLGHCPQGAITIEKREAEKYDEKRVMENILRQGENVIREHLLHLKEQGEIGLFKQAVEYLEEKEIANPLRDIPEAVSAPSGLRSKGAVSHGDALAGSTPKGGCPGSRTFNASTSLSINPSTTLRVDFRNKETNQETPAVKIQSQLKQWPIQLHLISPTAPYYEKADVLLVADCVAYALGNFHQDYLKGKSIAIACPKLDKGQDIYVEKISSWLEEAKINTLTVLIMQVPCCKGLLQLAQTALSQSKRKVPLKYLVISLQGEILKEEWIQ